MGHWARMQTLPTLPTVKSYKRSPVCKFLRTGKETQTEEQSISDEPLLLPIIRRCSQLIQ